MSDAPGAGEAMCHEWFAPIPDRDLAARGVDPANPNHVPAASSA